MRVNAIERLTAAFRQYYGAGRDPDLIVRAPGRVNLIGEHTDYNDGYVLPAAIDRAVYIAASRCASRLVSLSALDFDDGASFRVTEVAQKVDALGKPLKAWARYPAGVAWALQELGLETPGVDAVLTSTVPIGAGLSSSAAVEVAFAVLWRALGGWEREAMTLARACQRAENQYVGVNSGLMDQFAAAHGKEGHALFLDCRTLEWQAVRLPPDVSIVIADTKVRRSLGGSAYNERVAQCHEAARILSQALPGVRALRDVSPAAFSKHAHALPEIVRQRAEHVIEECNRALKSVEWLSAGDAASFGAAMNDSHASLRDLYEVSCPELNAMAEAAQRLDGCYGARLTGAGFGGCAVALVASNATKDFERELAKRYEATTGIGPDIYVCRATDGAAVL